MPLAHAVDEWVVRVSGHRVPGCLRGLRVAGEAGRVEARRGDHGQHRAGPRVERHDGTLVAAQLRGREILQPAVDGQRQVLRLRPPGQDLVEQLAQWIGVGAAGQQVVPGPLHPGRPVAQAGVADHLCEGRITVAAPARPVHHHAGGEQQVPGVKDRAARGAASGGDHLWVVLAGGQVLRVDHLPPAQPAGHDRERENEIERQAADVDRDHAPCSRASASNADRWLMASSRPITTKLASRLDPP